MNILCVIPSRMGSTRLPCKPLLPIQGKPMIEWVYEKAVRCSSFTKVVVATDHQDIADVITRFGGTVVFTPPEIKTGSDRVAFVAKDYPEMEVVVNVQGDEPFIRPSMLEALVAPYLAGDHPEMTTLAHTVALDTIYHDPNSVKVITDVHQNALYFSRAPIPYDRQNNADMVFSNVYQHVGVYAFLRDFLLKYTALPQTPLEKIESLEQLRALEHGYRIRVCVTDYKTLEINTPEELARAQVFTECG